MLFYIKQHNHLWKKTFKTIHQLSSFVGHPVYLYSKLEKSNVYDTGLQRCGIRKFEASNQLVSLSQ